jgi:hypothetical protein
MKLARYIFPLMVLAFLIQGTACKKTGPAEAVVLVQDSTGRRIAGATVVLRQDSITNPVNGVQASINQTGITDGAGQAFFTFKLEAVLIVEVENGNLSARDFIRLEQSKQVTKLMLIR